MRQYLVIKSYNLTSWPLGELVELAMLQTTGSWSWRIPPSFGFTYLRFATVGTRQWISTESALIQRYDVDSTLWGWIKVDPLFTDSILSYFWLVKWYTRSISVKCKLHNILLCWVYVNNILADFFFSFGYFVFFCAHIKHGVYWLIYIHAYMLYSLASETLELGACWWNSAYSDQAVPVESACSGSVLFCRKTDF